MYSQCKCWMEPAVAGIDTNNTIVRRLLRGIERCVGCATRIGAAWSYTVPITNSFFSLGF
jgi:hypothetical protein